MLAVNDKVSAVTDRLVSVRPVGEHFKRSRLFFFFSCLLVVQHTLDICLLIKSRTYQSVLGAAANRDKVR